MLRKFVLALILGCFLFASANAVAAIKNVSTDTTYPTIQAAIDAASDGHVIIVDKDITYTELIDFNGLDITVRSGVTDSPADTNDYSATTIIASPNDINDVVTFASGESNLATLKGFTISGGNHGIYVSDSGATIENCIITENSASGNGGGLYGTGSSDVFIRDCSFISNSAYYGGAIYTDTNVNATILDTQFTSNSSDRFGGAIYVNQKALTITNCNFSNNVAGIAMPTFPPFPDGGAIYLYRSSSNITNCQFNSNQSVFNGGAIAVDRADPTVSNCLFTNNVSALDGGAIYLKGSSPDILNCTFASNTASPSLPGYGLGGGIFCSDFGTSIGSSPTITDCIFSSHRYYAIAEYGTNSDPVITFCMFYQNTEGDLYDYDSATAYYKQAPSGQLSFADFSDPVHNPSIDTLNFGGNPKFVTGKLGNYYLSQSAAGQAVTGDSNAIDAGSDIAAAVGLGSYQTSTDSSINDTGFVDLGYHYNDPDVTPDVNLAFNINDNSYTVNLDLTSDVFVSVNDVNVSSAPQTFTFKKYSEAEILVNINNAPDWELLSWNGTDNDSEPGNNPPGSTANFRKVLSLNSNRAVTANFGLKLVQVSVMPTADSELSEYIYPAYRDNYMVRRGTVVQLTARPVDKSNVVIWNGTDHDDWDSMTNEVTAEQDTVVMVKFYAPRTLHVSNDIQYYTDVNTAIEDAQERDIVLISGDHEIQGLNLAGKNITIKGSGATPNDVTLHMMDTGGEGLVSPAFSLTNVGRATRIENLTIEGFRIRGLNGINGRETADDGGWAQSVYGPAFYLTSASPVITNVIIRDCGATGGNGGNGANGSGSEDPNNVGGDGGEAGYAYGGAIAIINNSDPLIRNVTFEDCYAIGGNGGDGGNGSTDRTNPGAGGRPGGWFDHGLNPRPSGFGGAIYIGMFASPTIENCSFVRCYSSSGLNGISGEDGWLPHDRDVPFNRYKIDNAGGAVYCEVGSSPTFINCDFIDCYADPNTALDSGLPNDTVFVGYGGAVYARYSTPTFIDCNFIGNYASAGGSIAANQADMRLDNCTITYSSATIGGGIQFLKGNPIVTRSTIASNFVVESLSNDVNTSSLPFGGGVACLGSNGMFRDTILTQNSSNGYGGAFYIANKDIDQTDITGVSQSLIWNCLITSNQANAGGGGIYAFGHAEPNIINCTIARNRVTGTGYAGSNFGGGILAYDRAYPLLLNTIVWNNTTASGIGNEIALRGGSENYSGMDIYYSNVKGGLGGPLSSSFYIQQECLPAVDWDYSSNLSGFADSDPNFVASEGYYLAQDPCQSSTSPCVDAGSADVNTLFYRHTTNTTGAIDTSQVDMGFHYLAESALTGDLNYDGVIDEIDVVLMGYYWLETDCAFPDWCAGRDFNQDGKVNNVDLAIVSGDYHNTDPNIDERNLADDILPPSPNPMKWQVLPTAISGTEIQMIAAQAYDNTGSEVQFEFRLVDANGDPCGISSGWVDEPNYIDTGLDPNAVYGYRVRAKDEKGNITDWTQLAAYAQTISDGTVLSDHTPPAWYSGAWSQYPPQDANTGELITISAKPAYDDSGVDYSFICYNADTNSVIADYSSDFQTSLYHDVTILIPGNYKFQIVAQDRSPYENYTVSEFSNIMTVASDGNGIDVSPPALDYAQPILSYNQTGGDPYVYLILTAQVPTDETEPIYYMFRCSYPTYNNYPGMMQWHSGEGSQVLNLYMGVGMTGAFWQVKFRDGANNETDWMPASPGLYIPNYPYY